MDRSEVSEETWMEFDMRAAAIGLERVPEGEESHGDYIPQTIWGISGPDEDMQSYPIRYRLAKGAEGDPAIDNRAPFTITHEVAPDGGVAVYKMNRTTGDKEWICGYGGDDALLFVMTNFYNVVAEWYEMEMGHWPPKGRTGRAKIRNFWKYVQAKYDSALAISKEGPSGG